MFSPGFKPLHDHHHHNHHHHGLWKMETQSRPTQEGLRGGGGGVDGSGSRAGGLEGLIKTVAIHSVLQWFMSAVGTNLAHGLWKSGELRTCKQVRVCGAVLAAGHNYRNMLY